MSDLSFDAKAGQSSKKGPREISAVNIAAWVMLLLISLANAFIASVITAKFRQIYADAIPGQILPPLTSFLLDHQFLVVSIACLWPILGFPFVLVSKRTFANYVLAIGLLAINSVQLGGTVLALFLPMSHLPIMGLSPTP